jgi:UDP-N-acetylmuramoylalanine--D-glutamate ligase
MAFQLRDQPVLVLGHGISGQAMARWCVRLGARVTVADTRLQPELMQRLQTELDDLARQVTTHTVGDDGVPAVVCAPFDDALMARQTWAAVCKSPGLSPAQLQVVADWATARGVPVLGELDLFADGLRRVYANAGFAPKVLAITGTNGKTTTTSLTGQLLSRAGMRVAVAGNIGPAMLDVLAEAADVEQKSVPARNHVSTSATDSIDQGQVASTADDADTPVLAPDANADAPDASVAEPEVSTSTLPQVWVLELSSFQLDGVRTGPNGFEPTAGTVLNVTQDHLDWHGSMAHYAAAKNRVYGQSGLRVLNREDATVMAAQPAAPEPVRKPRGAAAVAALSAEPAAQPVPWVTFGTDVPRRPGDWGLEVVNGMAWLVRAQAADETRLKRKATQAAEDVVLQRLMPAEALRIRGRHNAANALAALALATTAGASLAPMLYGLREYAGEPHRVSSVAIINGVEFIDDSKGTNVGATLAAIRGLGADRRLVMIMGGEGKGQDFSPLADAVRAHVNAVVLIGRDAPAIRAALAATGVPLLDAPDLTSAVHAAAEQAHEGDVVVMSPACASLDMFRNYSHRAEVFCAAVDELAIEVGMLGGQA